jgi:CRP-like cAMP-binding protein
MRDLNLRNLRRVLALRQFPFLEHAELDELATIAENVIEKTVPAGTVIATAGSRLRHVQLVVDGRIEVRPHGPIWLPRHIYGALEVFAHREVAHTAIAATELHTLQFSAREIGEILEDNFGVLLATVRVLAGRVLATQTAAPREVTPASTAQLGLVERLIVLRQQLPFATAGLPALATLAHASEEVSWPAQAIIAHAGEPATSATFIVAGSALALRDYDVSPLRAGAAIGLLETLAGAPHSATVETLSAVRALRCTSSAILDVLEDHTDIGIAMLEAFAAELLDREQTLRRRDALAA